ncbi:hypothetical protein D3C75_893090 [compost metagenome]
MRTNLLRFVVQMYGHLHMKMLLSYTGKYCRGLVVQCVGIAPDRQQAQPLCPGITFLLVRPQKSPFRTKAALQFNALDRVILRSMLHGNHSSLIIINHRPACFRPIHRRQKSLSAQRRVFAVHRTHAQEYCPPLAVCILDQIGMA